MGPHAGRLAKGRCVGKRFGSSFPTDGACNVAVTVAADHLGDRSAEDRTLYSGIRQRAALPIAAPGAKNVVLLPLEDGIDSDGERRIPDSHRQGEPQRIEQTRSAARFRVGRNRFSLTHL